MNLFSTNDGKLNLYLVVIADGKYNRVQFLELLDVVRSYIT